MTSDKKPEVTGWVAVSDEQIAWIAQDRSDAMLAMYEINNWKIRPCKVVFTDQPTIEQRAEEWFTFHFVDEDVPLEELKLWLDFKAKVLGGEK